MSLFPNYFQTAEVVTFFTQMNQVQSKDRMHKFNFYHSKEVLDRFAGLWPPPSIWEIWNRWDSLPIDQQSEYIPK